MDNETAFEVEFQPVGKRVVVSAGVTVLDAARQAGIDLTSACGGEGNCGQCRVVVLSGSVTPLSADEAFLLPESDRSSGYRLACCTKALSALKVHLPKDSLVIGQRLQVESNLRSISPVPLVRRYTVELAPPSLQDIRSDLARLVDGLETAHGLGGLHAGPAVICSLPPTLRLSGWQATVFVRDREIVGACPAVQKPLGLAVDLGTTKIAALLVDLESGETLASGGAANPQISYGEDVISRLNYAVRNPDGGQALAGKVSQALEELAGELLRQVGGERNQVADACIVGNTAMIHLLLRFPVRQLATAPYVAASSAALDVPAGELGLSLAPGAYVHIPPAIGGFVGADHVAMALASDLDRSDKVSLGLDIGTNTEISLRLPGLPHLTAVSCASGPAFEGAHIRDGMRAASGAIEKVRLGAGGPELTTIDDAPAVGLCGSGILDTIAELYRVGYLNSHGRFQREQKEERSGEQRSVEPGAEFVLVPAGRSGSGRDIAITQKDVNELGVSSGKSAQNPMVWMFLHKGAGGFMSDEQFATFYWPSLRELIMALINEGLTPVVYSEGDYTPRLERIADLPKGKVIWHYETVDIHKAKEIMGDVACFMGNVPNALLAFGTPGDVEAYCKKLIEVVGKDGRLIMDTGAALDEARPENVMAMVKATRKYGVYG